MKKSIYALITFSILVLLVIACNKEELNFPNPLGEDPKTGALLKDGGSPDLIIDTLEHDIPSNTTMCGTTTPIPNVHCDGGVRNFKVSATIRNIGDTPVPAGELEVFWADLFFGTTSIDVISHSGIPPNGTVVSTRQFYVGPCDCVPGDLTANCFIHSYIAFVDPFNNVAESDEGNNFSELLETCDGCGPCLEPVPSELTPFEL